jgi:hypothetical protein
MSRPNCDRCNTIEDCWGIDVRKRLEELSGHEKRPLLVQSAPKPDLSSPLRTSCLASVISSDKEESAEPTPKAG